MPSARIARRRPRRPRALPPRCASGCTGSRRQGRAPATPRSAATCRRRGGSSGRSTLRSTALGRAGRAGCGRAARLRLGAAEIEDGARHQHEGKQRAMLTSSAKGPIGTSPVRSRGTAPTTSVRRYGVPKRGLRLAQPARRHQPVAGHGEADARLSEEQDHRRLGGGHERSGEDDRATTRIPLPWKASAIGTSPPAAGRAPSR